MLIGWRLGENDEICNFYRRWLPSGFYSSEIHGENIPERAIEITDDQWREFINNSGRRRWQDGRVIEYTPPAIERVIKIPSVALWERMTNAEAELVETAMSSQPFRIRQIFMTAQTFRSDHELWPLLEQMATDLFGTQRAAELLTDPSIAPSLSSSE